MTVLSQIRHDALVFISSVAVVCCLNAAALAQSAPPSSARDEIVVTGQAPFDQTTANLPLGKVKLADLPISVTTIPQELIVNDMPRTVNDTLRYLPSVEIRDQQGLEVSRP